MTTIRFSETGLETGDDDRLHRTAGFLDCVLRGVGQVMFQNNRYAGLLFIIGIGYNSLLFAAAVLVGTVVSTITAIVLGADRTLIRSGMFGFNGGLVGIALFYFLQPVPLTWACVVLSAACSTIVMAAMLAAFDLWKLPVLTAPFVFTSLCFFLATARFGRLESTGLLPTAGLPKTAAVEGIVTASTVGQGLLNGIAQVFFQGNVVTGMLFAAGLLLASRMAFVMALTGSLAGLLIAWGWVLPNRQSEPVRSGSTVCWSPLRSPACSCLPARRRSPIHYSPPLPPLSSLRPRPQRWNRSECPR